MSDIIEATLTKADFISHPGYEEYVSTDAEARRIASELIQQSEK